MRVATAIGGDARLRARPLVRARGMVIAAARPAANAGAQVIAEGGNAADAAVATAAMLVVVDPQNCGVGGYGGFAVIDDGRGDPQQVAFNTTVPRAFDPAAVAMNAAGSLVTPPAVVPGLARLHAAFGRLPWPRCWAPAIAAARDGVPVGRDLATALHWAREHHRGLNDGFRATFLRNGEAPHEGESLLQPDLARTLEAVAARGAGALRRGTIVEQIVAAARAAGGTLDMDDFEAMDATLAPAASTAFGNATVHVPDREQSGGGILLDALAALDGHALGAARAEHYVRALADALAQAWKRRDAAFELLSPPGSQTTQLCCADPQGMLVALTFTHGPSWFGSGVVAEGTGVVLNAGVRLLVRRRRDGAKLAQNNLTPTIVCDGDRRYALGTPGARRIPAVVLQLVLDLVHYDIPLPDALAGARLSATADGAIDAEPALVAAFPQLRMRAVAAREYYGPAAALAWRDGVAEGATDPRFAGSCAVHDPI